MPLISTALTAGKAAFALVPKDKETRKKRAEQIKKGFSWLGRGLSKIKGIKRTEQGYSVTYEGQSNGSGKTASSKTLDISGFGAKKEQSETIDYMKYAPYVIGGLILLNMKR